MKQKFFAAMMMLAMSVVFVYAQKGAFTENRRIETFNSINACCGIEIHLTEGSSRTLKVDVNRESLLAGLITEVRNGVLLISYDDEIYRRPSNSKMRVYLEASNLTSISCSSGSNVIGKSTINASDISLSCSSGSNIKLDLNAKNIVGDFSSGSNIILSGKATSAVLDSSSGSNVNLKEMVVETVKAHVSSGSNAVVYATKTIRASASSGASIVYYGEPKEVYTDKSSGGSISKK